MQDESRVPAVFVFAIVASLAINGLLVFLFLTAKPTEIPFSPTAPDPVARVITEKEFSQMQDRRIVVDSKAPEASQDEVVEPGQFLGDQTRRVKKQMLRKGQGGTLQESAQNRPSKQEGVESPNIDRLSLGRWGWSHEKPGQKSSTTVEATTGLLVGEFDSLDPAIVQGPETLLNTDEFKYAGFVRRIRSEVFNHWTTRIEFATQQQRPTQGKWLTVVEVQIDADGEIETASIVRESGSAKLDEAARTAILALIRVPNVPEGLRDPGGKFRVRWPFQLTVETKNSPLSLRAQSL